MSEGTTVEVTLAEAARAWARVALHSFGGPAAQVAVMHRVVVEERRWIGEARFLHALSFCMLLPGPEAQQLATYLGWLLHGWRGGLLAGGLFVLPGFLSILALSVVYVTWAEVPAVAAALHGVQAATLAVVAEAVLRLGRRVLTNGVMRAVAVGAFVALSVFSAPFPAVVAVAGLVGVVGGRAAPGTFRVMRLPQGPADGAPALLDAVLDARGATAPSLARTARTVVVWLVVWWAPLGLLVAALGGEHVLVRIGVFLSQAAVVTFGGAYAVLAWVGQQAVDGYGWLSPREMVDGLALAESTPGPLIQVVQFVAFLAAWRAPGALDPWVAALAGSVVATWATFAPCFLWIFAGAPYVEWLRGDARLVAALSTITAAVVGVVANLGAWLAMHVLFEDRWRWVGAGGAGLDLPVLSSVHAPSVAIALAAAVALLRLHVGLLPVLAGAAVVGALVG